VDVVRTKCTLVTKATNIVETDSISATYPGAVQPSSTPIMKKVHAIKLLQASIDRDDISEFRLLVDHQHIKYVTVDPYIFDE
jgi:hypothetical protein